MSHFPVTEINISMVRVGDTVIHMGKEMTVSPTNLKRDPFMGVLLFGDSYRLGYQKVKRVEINKAVPK